MIDVLRESRIFEGMDIDALHRVSAICRERTFPPGTTIFAENQPADTLYVVKHGEVVTQFRRPMGDPIVVRHVTRGELFGWAALFRGRQYVASAVCETEVTVLAMARDEFLSLLKADVSFGFRVMSRLARLLAFRLSGIKSTLLATLDAGP